MATYLSPGVYVQEVDSGPKPIAGVPTSVGALIGATEKGPVLEPRRLTGWNDYLDVFGGPIAGSYTAESAFGFFQNGGTALWVTRADRASLSRWRVSEGSGAESFFVEAASPGAWSAGMKVAVTRSTGGGQGLMYAAGITGPAGEIDLSRSDPVTVVVESTIGARSGMSVTVADITSGAPVDATIESVGTGTLTLTADGTGRKLQLADDPHVSARVDAGATTLELASGSGFGAGDVIVAVPPAGAPQGAAVESATGTGIGAGLALAAPFTTDVRGQAFEERTFTVPVQVQSATANKSQVALDRLTGVEGLVDGEMVRLTLGGGLSAAWSANARFEFAVDVAPGPGEVVARLGVAPYSETVALTITAADTAADDALNTRLGRFNFVPENAKLTLTRAGTATKVDFTRTATGWTKPTGTLEGDYDAATVTPTSAQGFDATKGLVVTAARAPQAGDYVAFGGPAGTRRITAVEQPTGAPPAVYVLKFGTTFSPATPTVPAGAPKWPLRAWQPTRVHTLRFGLEATLESPAGTMREVYPELSLNPTHPRYYLAEEIVNQPSRLIRVMPRTATTAATSPDSLPATVARAQAGGTGVLDVDAFSDALEQLERASEPALLAAPDALLLGDDMLISAAFNELARHAREFRRFAIIDLPHEPSDTALLEWRMLRLDSTHAAAYAPFVRIPNLRRPQTPLAVEVPPSGFVMGVFARTDNDRGVWKAPANERVEGIDGPVIEYTQRRQDLLNPRGVNLLRPFSGRGTRVWGARNLTDDTTWRYVNVRRLFLFLENSIDAGTQWVVFEPNDATTWLRVRVSVEDFLNQVWRAGGLAGASPEQAYRVRCGLGTTMTETDVALGLLAIEVAVAPVYPAEFVVFRISHKRLAE